MAKSRGSHCGFLKLLTLALVVAAIPSALWAAPPPSPAGTRTKDGGQATAGKSAPLPTMVAFRALLEQLLPYAGSKQAFADSANLPIINSTLKQLQGLAAHPGHPRLEQADNRMTLQILSDLLDDARRDLNTMHPETARTRVHWAMDVCTACHSRLPTTRQVDVDPLLANIQDTYARARLRFTFRDFDNAERDFLALVQGYPSNGLTALRLSRSLEYLATIAVRVNLDAKRALSHFAPLAKRANLPKRTRDMLQQWVQDIRTWRNEKTFVASKASDKAYIAHARSILGQRLMQEPPLLAEPQHLIRYLRTSGVLHRFLDERDRSPLVPQAYQLLGLAYMQLNRPAFVGLDDVYFKACIHQAPRTATAQRCYAALEQNSVLGYSGSSGTHLPPKVRSDLLRLAKKAGSKVGEEVQRDR